MSSKNLFSISSLAKTFTEDSLGSVLEFCTWVLVKTFHGRLFSGEDGCEEERFATAILW